MDSSTDERTDKQLVEAINGGDLNAFEPLYLRYRDWVVRVAFRFTGDREEALDVLQETFAYVAGKFPGFVLRAKMTTFLYPVVRSLSISARRKRSRSRPLRVLQEVPGSAPPAPHADLGSVVSGLSPEHREVVLMRFVDDMSLQEIAHALRIPLGTVKSRLHHALAALRRDPRVRNYFE